MPRRRFSRVIAILTEDTPACRRSAPIPRPGPRATPPVCTGSSTTPWCCPRRRSASTRVASCGPTRCGSGSRPSTSMRRRSASSRARTRVTATPYAREVLEIVASRGKMQNPVTGSGGMLVGTVEEVGPESPLGLAVGDRVATLVSLTLDPAGDRRRPGAVGRPRPSRSPRDGYAILFGRSIAAKIPDDLPRGAEPRRDGRLRRPGPHPPDRVAVRHRGRDAAGRWWRSSAGRGSPGSLSLAAAARARCGRTVGVVPNDAEAALLRESGLADDVVVADARDPIALRDAVAAAGGPADVTVVCVDVPGCEGGAILATADQGTVIFFSMATSFSAAALGAEGLAADVTMLVGNGYTPGHAAYALELLRAERRRPPALRAAAVMAATTRPRPRGPRPRPGDRPPGPRRLARKVGQADRRDRPAAHHRLRRAGHAPPRRSRGCRRRGHPVGQPARRLRPRRRRTRARRRAPGLGRRSPGRGRRPARAGPEGLRRVGAVPPARGHGRPARHARQPVARSAPASAASTSAAASASGSSPGIGDARREALDLPDRRHRRHLRGHPPGTGGRPRGRGRHRGDPLDRPEPARLRARGCDP